MERYTRDVLWYVQGYRLRALMLSYKPLAAPGLHVLLYTVVYWY